jgi:hypothetical protein
VREIVVYQNSEGWMHDEVADEKVLLSVGPFDSAVTTVTHAKASYPDDRVRLLGHKETLEWIGQPDA